MPISFAKQISALIVTALFAVTAPVIADTTKSSEADKAHSHDHKHEDKQTEEKADQKADDIYKGYFEDDQIKARPLSNWAGDWQSVYPHLQEGSLEAVMQHKAESGKKTVDEYKAYYSIGYATDVDRIVIKEDSATFFSKGETAQGQYADDGHEILTYKAGNRGVRFIFKKVSGDAAAPAYFQFSDHKIAPDTADHYHLYWGDDRAALLEEVTNWPTYYPAGLTGAEIAAEMLAH